MYSGHNMKTIMNKLATFTSSLTIKNFYGFVFANMVDCTTLEELRYKKQDINNKFEMSSLKAFEHYHETLSMGEVWKPKKQPEGLSYSNG